MMLARVLRLRPSFIALAFLGGVACGSRTGIDELKGPAPVTSEGGSCSRTAPS
jgi:hypothetical protein